MNTAPRAASTGRGIGMSRGQHSGSEWQQRGHRRGVGEERCSAAAFKPRGKGAVAQTCTQAAAPAPHRLRPSRPRSQTRWAAQAPPQGSGLHQEADSGHDGYSSSERRQQAVAPPQRRRRRLPPPLVPGSPGAPGCCPGVGVASLAKPRLLAGLPARWASRATLALRCMLLLRPGGLGGGRA